MQLRTTHLNDSNYPSQLARLHKAPDAIYVMGRELDDILSKPRVAVVGSRAITPYGRQMTRDIVKQLVSYGVVIVSGLAYGIDAEAHQAALDAHGVTMAVLPSPLQSIAPAGNQHLACRILNNGGTLFSTYVEGSQNHKGNFVQRNEYVAALSQAVILVEAGVKSGARHTANFANGEEIGVPVFAVPGRFNDKMSVGCNQLIASSKASAFTSVKDVLQVLQITTTLSPGQLRGDTPAEQAIIDLLFNNVSSGQDLLAKSQLDISTFNQSLTMLEVAGKIRPLGGNQWGLS